jgi:DNA-binding SARP family transcriptional activator/tetratricopeptide (TPR) repeat protein
VGKPRVELRLLGGFGVHVDGVAIGDRWPTRRASELVQLLAIAPGHRLVRDEVIEALWPHLPADAGGANLRKAAHLARRALGHDEAVVLRQQQVALFPGGDVESDLEAFTSAACAALADRDPGQAARVAASYGGELLPGARYEAWSETARHEAADRHLGLLRLAGLWERVLERDPTDEAAARAAMEASLASGHRHRAIALYGHLRQVLREQLGVVPSDATEEVYHRCRAGLAPAPARIVGRHEELAALDELLDACDRAELVLVTGPAGIGKTAMLRELDDRASQRGRVTIDVTADDPNDAYATLAAVFERLVDGRRQLVEELDAKTRSVLGTVIPLALDTDPLELPLTRHQVLGAAQRVITAVAGDRGLALMIDDADQADQASLEVLASLGDRNVGALLVALAYRQPHRNAALDRAIARASRIQRPTVLTLGPLVAADVELLARTVEPQIDERRVATVVERSEGVPFFVVELAAAGPGEVGNDAIRTAIEARIVDLGEHEVAWLRRLAIAGSPVDLDAVLALTGCSDAEADQLLDRAIASGVLVVDDNGYRFRHQLVRSALAGQLPPHQQAAVHRDAARRLAELGARPGRIAAHWVEGHRPAEAAQWFVRAGAEAMRLGGYAAAVEYLDSALVRVPAHGEALRRRAQSLDALGDPRAIAAYDAAIAVATPEEVHDLKPLQALAQVKGGDPEGAVATIAGAQPNTLESQVAHALTMSGAALLGAVGPEAGARLSAAARKKALRSGDLSAVVVAAWSQAAISHAQGGLRDSLWADLADTRALPRLALTVFDGQLCITQRLLYGNRPYDDVIQFTNDFAAEAQRVGSARAVAFATTLRGEAELLSGRLDDAERDLVDGARLHQQLGAATGHAFSLQRLAELAHLRGEHGTARRMLDEALEIARTSDVGFHLLDRIYGTKIQLADNPAEALDAVLEAEEAVRGPLETCPGCRITLDVPAAIAAADAGDLERAGRYEQTCTFLADVVMRLPAWDAALHEVRAHRSLAHGDMSGAAELFRRAAATFEAVGQPFDARRCNVRAAALNAA